MTAIRWFVGTSTTLFALSVVIASGAVGKDPPDEEFCDYWQSKVVVEVPLRGEAFELPSTDELVRVCECLLELRGDSRPARFGGARRVDVSEIFGPVSSEIGALYYLSYIFYGDDGFSDAVTLIDEFGKPNQARSVDRAFASASQWLEQVSSVGLDEVGLRGLDPLFFTTVTWYGGFRFESGDKSESNNDGLYLKP